MRLFLYSDLSENGFLNKVMRKTLLLLVLSFCVTTVSYALKTPCITSDTLQFPKEKITADRDEVHTCTSEDGNMKFYSWDTHLGGTMPSYGGICQFRTSDGKVRTIEMHELDEMEIAWVNSVHSLKKEDGTTLYIVARSHRISSACGYMWMEGFVIKENTVKRVSVYNGSSKPDEDFEMSIEEYSIPDWYYKTSLLYDCRYAYDTETRELYIPEQTDFTLTDRYHVYYFDGDRFVYSGLKPHKGLHDALYNYKELLKLTRSKDYIVRIDMLENGNMRYASWKMPKDISSEPDIIIIGGEYDKENNVYTFRNGEYSYVIGEKEIEPTENKGVSYVTDFLTVKKNNKTILKQALE